MKCDIIQMSVVNNLEHVITRIGGHTMSTCGDFGCCHGKPLGLIFETRKTNDKQEGDSSLKQVRGELTGGIRMKYTILRGIIL